MKTDKADQQSFTEKFEVIKPVQQKDGPWEYEQPLKSRPAVFEDNHPAE